MAVEIKFGDHIKEAIEIGKANLVPTVLTMLIAGIANIIIVAPAIVVSLVVDQMIGSLLQIPLSIIGGGLTGLFFINFMAAVKAAKHEGKKIELGDVLKFDNAVNKILTHIAVSIGFAFCCIPGVILCWAPCIIADKPGTSFTDALKAALAFGKGNIVPLLILLIVCGLFAMVGYILCILPGFFTIPVAQAAIYLAYDTHKASVEAAAAEAGVQLS